jgi:hypothetical protein
MRFSVAGLGLGVLLAGSACAQYVISAHSGVVQYVEGRAYLDNKVVDPKFGQFPDIKTNQEFRTEEGRAEILLTPGVFLRLGESSSIRMLSNKLTDTRVEVLSGSAIIECADVPKDNAIAVVYKGNTIQLQKQGLYRLDTEPAHFKVFQGEAVVRDGSGQLTLKGGKETNLGGVLMAENFDRKDQDQDALYRWSDRRASYVAQANVASAAASSGSYGGYYNGLGFGGGLGYLGYGYGFTGGWAFNPIFGMYTYLPYDGFGYSPYGYTYYSPYTVGYAPSYGGGGGYYSGSRVSRVAGLAGGSRLAHAPAGRGAGFSSFAGARSFGGGARSFGGGARSFGGGSIGAIGGGGGRSFGGGGGGSFGGGGGGHASMGGGGGGGHMGGGGGHR